MKYLEIFENFKNINEIHIFDFDDTLVSTPRFEDLAIKYIKESKNIQDILMKSIDIIDMELVDLRVENGRIFIDDPKGSIKIKNNWVRKGSRVYLTTPDIFHYMEESLPNKLKEISNLYNSVENKCIVTARPEGVRDKLIKNIKSIGLDIPKYGLYMKPDYLKNAGEWKGYQICDIISKFGFNKATFYDDNPKYIRKVKRVVSEKLPNFDFRCVKVV
jgi:predicted protein tyrosine phosphatase